MGTDFSGGKDHLSLAKVLPFVGALTTFTWVIAALWQGFPGWEKKTKLVLDLWRQPQSPLDTGS